MACAWRHIVVMNWLQGVWQKNCSYTHRRNTGGVCGQLLSADRHLLPLLCCLVVDKVIDGLNGNGYYTLGMHYPHQQKIHKYCLTASSGGFEYGTTVVSYNSDINPSTKGSEP